MSLVSPTLKWPKCRWRLKQPAATSESQSEDDDDERKRIGADEKDEDEDDEEEEEEEEEEEREKDERVVRARGSQIGGQPEPPMCSFVRQQNVIESQCSGQTGAAEVVCWCHVLPWVQWSRWPVYRGGAASGAQMGATLNNSNTIRIGKLMTPAGSNLLPLSFLSNRMIDCGPNGGEQEAPVRLAGSLSRASAAAARSAPIKHHQGNNSKENNCIWMMNTRKQQRPRPAAASSRLVEQQFITTTTKTKRKTNCPSGRRRQGQFCSSFPSSSSSSSLSSLPSSAAWAETKAIGRKKSQIIRTSERNNLIGWCARLLLLLLLVVVAVAAARRSAKLSSEGAVGSSAPPELETEPSAGRNHSCDKIDFWRQFLGPLLQGGGSDLPSSHLLADRLARWPNGRQAALLAAELLARSPHNCQRRVSLAQLMAGDWRAAELLLPGQRVEEDEEEQEAGGVASTPGRHLYEWAQFVRLAQVARDNANLVARLMQQRRWVPDGQQQQAQMFLAELVESERFLDFLLTNKLAAAEAGDRARRPALHSLGLLQLNASQRLQYAKVARAADPHQLIDLTRHVTGAACPAAAPLCLLGEHLPAFLSHWLSGGGGSGRVAAGAERDGRWFSPYFDCSFTNQWLVAFAVPIYEQQPVSSEQKHSKWPPTLTGDADSEQPAQRQTDKLRAISFVQFELSQAAELLDPCAGSGGVSFLAGTHQCAERLVYGQCVSVPPPNGAAPPLRLGRYLCRCPHWAPQVEPRDLERVLSVRRQRAAAAASMDFQDWPGDWQQADGSDGAAADQVFVAAGRELELDSLSELFARPESDSSWPTLKCMATEEQQQRRRVSLSRRQVDVSAAADSDTEPDPVPAEGNKLISFLRPFVLAMQIFCTIMIMVLSGILIRIRKSRTILVSGWLMLETMLIGALLLYASVLVRYFAATNFTCLIEPWLRELGFSVFYGSILIKLYKILTEFQTRKAHRVCLRDRDQLLYLVAIVLIVIGYMSAWTASMVDGFLVAAGQRAQNSTVRPRDVTRQLERQFGIQSADGYAASDDIESSGFKLPPEVELESGQRDDQQQQQQQQSTMNHLEHLIMMSDSHLRLFTDGLNSFIQLFSGLIEHQRQFVYQKNEFVTVTRCRKLTWNYVTESSEMALLMFGLNLVYKLRNASSDKHKEKLILCASVFIEIFVSAIVYGARHAFWDKLTNDHLLILYAIRSELTVTLTVALVFGPKLWTIGKTKPSLLFGPLACSFVPNSAGRLSGGHARENPHQQTADGPKSGGSVRHRCHISCELHDHHLNDKARLQQMLTNSALDIGTIDLADMDPDEIQAELKRVYGQLEVLKTKIMRRDNPHISKRRGGRKPGHRKFSLQAFHGGNSKSHNQNWNSSAPVCPSREQQQHQQHVEGRAQVKNVQFEAAGRRLHSVAEMVDESITAYGDSEGVDLGDTRADSSLSLNYRDKAPANYAAARHVRLDGDGCCHEQPGIEQTQLAHDRHPSNETPSSSEGTRRSRNWMGGGTEQQTFGSSVTNTLTFFKLNRNTRRQNEVAGKQPIEHHRVTPEPPSTSSICFDDDGITVNDDSPSSGENSPSSIGPRRLPE